MSTGIDPASFTRLAGIVRELAGIDLKPGKEALVSGRLQKRMRELGIADWPAYLDLIERDAEGTETALLLDAISTNVTSFFRESDHFALLRSEAVRWAAEGRKRIRLWCAASSTGEEPWCMAMTVADALAGKEADVRLLATDISNRVLAHARKAVYAEAQVARVPTELRRRWFVPAGGETVRVHDRLRAQVTFNRLNLAHPPYPMKGPFDAIFVRNVMIYFDTPVRRLILTEARRLLRPGGILCVGSAESLGALQGDFLAVRPAAYRMPE